MRQFIFHIVLGALLGAIIGAIGVLLLTEGLPEGAIMGGLLGGSVSMLIAARRSYGDSAPSYEYEAAGIHDDNLITIARGNLVREAYRDSFVREIMDDKIERIASADPPKRS